ncbi:sensor histidine kinase [Candidatus Chloroploca sp. Khr17]|uniref:sensor histidine kinase n=1 Tax=Candidatus Chloroploca sp. Khr17 TaxID=2496869 RepID=UPI0013EE3791|nr:sensor histidine kinase [Candidatus Chloroploca sp. Khr17]
MVAEKTRHDDPFHDYHDAIPHGSVLNVSGVLAALVSVGLPLVTGVIGGWSLLRVLTYLVLAVGFLGLVIGYLVSSRIVIWANARIGLFLALSGLSGAALLVISGETRTQPLALTVPFVIAVISLAPRQASWVGVSYLMLILGGLWLGGVRVSEVLFTSIAIYASIFLFMYAVVQIALTQAQQRQQATALALENARLAREAGAAATLAERNRIARELHDTIAQGLTAITMQLEAAQRAFERDPERARVRLARAHELARTTLGDVRRSVWTLAETSLSDQQIDLVLQQQARQFQERTGIATTWNYAGRGLALPPEQAEQVARIVQEALVNIEKHAYARHVEVGLCAEEAVYRVWVRDDGVGFDPAQPISSTNGGGFGLISLRERARLAGGDLQLASRVGGGTTLSLILSVDQKRDEEQ